MKKEFVTFDIAKAIKYLGFNKPCLFYFHNGEIDFTKVSEYSLINGYKNSDMTASQYIAPMWQQVIDFFSEKYGVFIEIRFADKALTLYEFCVYTTFKELVNNTIERIKLGDEREVYTNPFEVREQAFLKAINVIQEQLRNESANFGNLLSQPSIKLNIYRKDLYEYDKPIDRTRKRLMEMADLGMEEIGSASFGVRDIMSGLYIEMVWSYDDEKWDDYINWVKELVIEKTKV